MPEHVIRTESLSRTVGTKAILSNVNLSLAGRQFVAVLGPNGAGKTTLLDLLAGLTEPSSGEIALFGQSLRGRKYPRSRVGVVLQREFVPDHMTVRDYAELHHTTRRRGMSALFVLAKQRVLDVARDRVSAFFFLGLPVLLLMILAVVFQGGHPFERKTIAVVQTGTQPTSFDRALVGLPELRTTRGTSLTAALGKLRARTVHAVVTDEGPQ